MPSDYLEYKPSSDIAALDSLWRQEQNMVGRRQKHLSQYTDSIKFNHGRGMSRATLEKKYGREAVLLALGQEIIACQPNTPPAGSVAPISTRTPVIVRRR